LEAGAQGLVNVAQRSAGGGGGDDFTSQCVHYARNERMLLMKKL
jgi:hypothetical protein